jgi:hypothetical protein
MMTSINKEGRILLAIQALERGQFKSERQAAMAYDINRYSLQRRRQGMASREDCRANNKKLTLQEEEALVRYIVDLIDRGYPPRVKFVGDLANLILQKRGVNPTGINWPSTFIKN